MIVFLIVLLVVVVGVVLAGVVGRFGGHFDEPTLTTPFEPLPRGEMTAEDIDVLRFDQTLRGYRMGQVDDVLDRLRVELKARDEEIGRLRAQR
ncbi:DivIVA domain-containing protein [Leekyejoonella antrihumi]|uniref:DivIVA domain-containing protein n=1 Tax=Leekyejoonella antrihumi TaxID=1660198 RepID=A0A563DX69_9MICO|nr:DivIVA domain-containing protein [Leekyejoonella antrihumi]TWP34542.1 DivIVA domain-containing protein [Leekyejoonella antrihumi]